MKRNSGEGFIGTEIEKDKTVGGSSGDEAPRLLDGKVCYSGWRELLEHAEVDALEDGGYFLEQLSFNL